MPLVIVSPPDPDWPSEFAKAAAEVRAICAENLIEIHHIGSTSVPGLWAKPIIDMLTVVYDLDLLDRLNSQFACLRYEPMGEFGIPSRRYFRRDNPAGIRTHQIHAFAVGSTHIERHLAFRDYLRSMPAVANEYASLKRRLAAAHPSDIEAYMDGKDSFIKETEALALKWKSTSKPMPQEDESLPGIR